jgi:hypothetical protein
MTRRRRREVLIAIVLLPITGGLALIGLHGGASSASTVAPSARPTATAFANAYVAYLNGRLAAAALPDMTADSRSLASSGGRVPASYQGKVVLRAVRFSGVLGATRANAELVAVTGSRTLDAVFTLGWAGGRWQVTELVPPDFSTVFSPPSPAVAVPADVRAAARSFALAYADYRTGAKARPPAGLPAIERQLAARQDPLASTPRSGAAARVLKLQILPQGQVTVVDAVLAAGSRRLPFGFILQEEGGSWQAASFPVSAP